MALANLNPRSTLKFLIASDFTGGEGAIVTIDAAATATAGVTVLKGADNSNQIPVGIIVVGAASDSGTYPDYATNCEIYDTLIGCFDGALCGYGGLINAGDAVSCDGSGLFTQASTGTGDFVIGYAMTGASEGEQFTIKFNVTQF
jgi:hypothetical protein